MKKAYLVLSDGTVYQGSAFGADAPAVGELVFTTGMVGYLETLTDPSYAGQIVLQTFPLIGNYGVIEADFEGEVAARGYVVREWCDAPSNFRCEYDLDRFLKERGVPGICGVDTRAITRKIRESGVMNAMITSKIPEDLGEIQRYAVTGVVSEVTCRAPAVHPAQCETVRRVALIDYGAKRNIIRELQKRGCERASAESFDNSFPRQPRPRGPGAIGLFLCNRGASHLPFTASAACARRAGYLRGREGILAYSSAFVNS